LERLRGSCRRHFFTSRWPRATLAGMHTERERCERTASLYLRSTTSSHQASQIRLFSNSGANKECIFARAGQLKSIRLYPKASFENDSELRHEVIKLLIELTNVSSVRGVNASMAVMRRLLFSKETWDMLSPDLLRRVIQNFGWSKQGRGSHQGVLVDRRLPHDETTVDALLYAHARYMVFGFSFSSVDRKFRDCWKLLEKNYAKGNKERLHQLNQSALNILVQLNAWDGRITEAMELAKDLIDGDGAGAKEERSGYNLRDEAFMSILAAAATSGDCDREKVGQFLDWAAAQYEANRVEINLESISLFVRLLMHDSASNEAPDWLLNKLDWVGQEIDETVIPGTNDYEKALALWTNVGDASRTKALFHMMLKDYKHGITLECCNLLMLALSVSGNLSAGHDASEILKLMEDGLAVPNYTTYKLVIQSWKHSEESDERQSEVIQLIKNMVMKSSREKSSQCQPDGRLIEQALVPLRGQPDVLKNFIDYLEKEVKKGNLESSVISIPLFTTLFKSLSSSGSKIASEMVLTCFHHVRRLHNEEMLESASPTEHYVLASFCLENSASANAGALLEKLLLEVEKLPTSQRYGTRQCIYRSLMRRHANAGRAEETEDTMKRMFKSFQEGCALKPEYLDYNIVLEAWANSDSPRGAERADAIVEHMKKLHDMGHLDVQPTGETYVILFRCWEKSDHPLARDRMESIKTEIEAIDAGLSGDQVKLFVPATVT